MSALPFLALDHLVVAATTLDEGIAWCVATLGTRPEAGGRHAFMGTHNCIFAIGSARFERAYFEIIAIDPGGTAPARPRWFGLDAAPLQRALRDGPCLIHWVARCADVHRAATAFRAAGFDPGDVVQAERATPHGLLRWQITVRADGARLCNGALPTLIEWGDVHPTGSLAPSDVRLEAVSLCGVADPVGAWLHAALGDDGSGGSHLSNAATEPFASANSPEAIAPRTAATAAAPLRVVLESPRGRVALNSLHGAL